MSRPAIVLLLAVASLVAPRDADAQSRAPELSKAQRAALEAVVTAANGATAATDAQSPATWTTHVLRASDGSHYVALRGHVPGVDAPTGPVVLYVRLASRVEPGVTTAVPERSAVLDWLKGLRSDPLPLQPGRTLNVPLGEMPVGGAPTATRRGSTEATDATSALRLMAHQQEREAERKREDERKRKAALESAERQPRSPIFPFEDFDTTARLEGTPGRGLSVSRGITAGPGDYDLVIAWADPNAPTSPPHVVTRRLTLPAATGDFGLGDVIVASAVTPLSAPYASTVQAAHPYAIGVLEAVPAAGNALSGDGSLGLVYQVMNPSATASGKPDVEVGFQVFRVTEGRDEPFARLETQRHSEDNLPSDFDVAKGHPLFGAVRAPLTSFTRGPYRVEITAVDRLAGRRVTSEARFEVRGTPLSLLKEAPAFGHAFRRDAILSPELRRAFVDGLGDRTPSEALARLIAAATAGQYAGLVRDEPVTPEERPLAAAMRAFGLYGLGDSPRAVSALVQQAVAQGAPLPPLRLLRGAVAALGNDDRTAITEWTAAREAGVSAAVLASPLVDALLRQGRYEPAQALARSAHDAAPADLGALHRLAAVLVASKQYAEALDVLDRRPSQAAPDLDGDFLAVHALYASIVTAEGPGTTEAGRARFMANATAYESRNGRHAALVREWRTAVDAPRDGR